MLINLRDRIYAHNDKESKVKDSETDVDLFQLVLYVANGEMKPGAQLIFHSETISRKYFLYAIRCTLIAWRKLMKFL